MRDKLASPPAPRPIRAPRPIHGRPAGGGRRWRSHLLTGPSADRVVGVNRQPVRAERSEPRSGALDAGEAIRSQLKRLGAIVAGGRLSAGGYGEQTASGRVKRSALVV